LDKARGGRSWTKGSREKHAEAEKILQHNKLGERGKKEKKQPGSKAKLSSVGGKWEKTRE